MNKVDVRFLILMLVCLGVGVYLISLFNSSRYGSMLYFISLALAILGLPLAALMKKGELVFLVLGLFFLAEGIYYVYFVSSWGPGRGTTPFDSLLGFSVLGLPMGILCLSIFFLWSSGKSTSRIFEVLQYSVCVLLHVINFIVAMLYPLSEITRLGGAGLAIGFGVFNFLRAVRP